MKYFLLSLFCFFMVGNSHADVNQELYELAKEKGQLSREAVKLLKKHNIDPNDDAEYKAASAKAFELSQKMVKARKKNSTLKPFYKVSDEAQSKMMKAMMAKEKDKEAVKKARNEYMTARTQLEKAAAKIPELVKMASDARAANDVASDIKLNLISSSPEGKEYLKKIDVLNQKIEVLRGQL